MNTEQDSTKLDEVQDTVNFSLTTYVTFILFT